MIKAIIYHTNTGSTKRYAEFLAKATGLPALPLGEAGEIKQNERVFYLGWVMGGRIRGYNRAAMRFDIVGACGVGISEAEEDTAKRIKAKTGITNPRIKVFYARGAFDMEKLNPVHRLFMGSVLRALKEGRGNGEETSLLQNGGDFVKKENIKAAANWIKACNRRSEKQ